MLLMGNVIGLAGLSISLSEACWAMSRILLKLAERSLPSMLLRDFQLFVKIPVMQLI
jgi:hypothetical protein